MPRKWFLPREFLKGLLSTPPYPYFPFIKFREKKKEGKENREFGEEETIGWDGVDWLLWKGVEDLWICSCWLPGPGTPIVSSCHYLYNSISVFFLPEIHFTLEKQQRSPIAEVMKTH